MRIKIITATICCLAALQVSSQNNAATDVGSMHMICRSIGDTLKLRWAPSDWNLLELMINNGFTLQKIQYEQGDSTVSNLPISIPTKNELRSMRSQYEYAEAAEVALYETAEDFANSDDLFAAYQRDELNSTRHGMLLFLADLDFQLAQKLGLGWQEILPRNIALTRYRIKVNNTVESADVFNDFNCSENPTPIEEIYAFPEDQKVVLTWNLANNPSGYIAFNVERSDDSLHWTIVNDHPIAISSEEDLGGRALMTHEDSVANLQEFYYRVRGINSFGEIGPMGKTVRTLARPRLTINYPYINSTKARNDSTIFLAWQIGGIDSNAIARINLLHSDKPGGNFQVLDSLSPEERDYEHETVSLQNYYIVQAVDIYGREYTGPPRYAQLADHSPPLPPSNVVASSDSMGAIFISWSANVEPDLLGYRVFFKRYLEDSIVQLTTAAQQDTSFQHKLELDMLRWVGYYLVRAEDQAGNRSANSQIASVIVPDTIPPARPTIVSGRSSIAGAHLLLSLSDSKDIQQQSLYRLQDGNWQATQFVADVKHSFQQEYFDSLLQEGQFTSYQLVAVDSSGNKSLSNIFQAGKIDNRLRPAPDNAEVTWNEGLNQLVFAWTIEGGDGVEAVRILRKPNDADHFRLYKMLRADALAKDFNVDGSIEMSYSIPFREKPKEHAYRIQLDFGDGAVSRVRNFSPR